MKQEILNKMWEKVLAEREYQKWVKKNDSFEQIGIIDSWCKFEDYSVSDLCDNASEVVVLFCYIHFVVGVEFLDDVYEMADEGDSDATFLIKALRENN